MQIQRRKIKLDVEKSILTGAIVSNQFLKDVYALLQENYHYFKSSYIRIVLGWIFLYYEENGKTPGDSIQDIYNIKSSELAKDADAEIIEDVLISISEKYEASDSFDVEYWTKRCTEYCKKMSLLNLASEIRGFAENNDLQRAEHLAGEYKRVDAGLSSGLDVDSIEADILRDKIYSPDNNLSVVRFPGAFGQVVGKLERGGLYLFCSNSKRGKSFLCIDVGKYCQMQGLNVHYYTLEMNHEKLLERRDMCLSKSLVYVDENDDIADEYSIASKRRISKDVFIPYFGDDNVLEYEQVHATSVTASKAKRASRLFKKQYKRGKFYVYDITTAGNTLSSIIRNEDMEEQYNGNVADVVIIDSIYNCADNMGAEKRHRWDQLHWMAKQELGEKRGKVVITPFQFNRAALKENDADESNMAEAYSVFHHASAALFLKATKEELRKGLMRISANGRDNNYTSGGEVVITRSLDIARGWIDSRFKSQIPNYDEFIKGEDMMSKEDEEELKEIGLDEL